MKSQKDELQRQRDTLQRQIDLFEAHRRHWMSTTERLTSPPTSRVDLRRSLSPSSEPLPDDTSTLGRTESGSDLPVRHLSPLGRAGVHDDRVISRVSSVGNVTTLDNRTVTRFGSVGSLSCSRWDSRTLPVHLMSTTNESRLSGTTSSPLRSTTSVSAQSVQQLIPTKLSTGASKTPRGVVDVEKNAAAGSHVGSRDSPPAAGTTSGNIEPMKLGEGERCDASRSYRLMSSECVSEHSADTAAAAAAAAGVDNGDDVARCKDEVFEAVDKDDHHSDEDILYF